MRRSKAVLHDRARRREDGCLIYAKDEHGDNLNVEMVECVGLPSLNTPIEEAIKMMIYTIINTAHACY